MILVMSTLKPLLGIYNFALSSFASYKFRRDKEWVYADGVKKRQ